jgi:hypothetical protein
MSSGVWLDEYIGLARFERRAHVGTSRHVERGAHAGTSSGVFFDGCIWSSAALVSRAAPTWA